MPDFGLSPLTVKAFLNVRKMEKYLADTKYLMSTTLPYLFSNDIFNKCMLGIFFGSIAVLVASFFIKINIPIIGGVPLAVSFFISLINFDTKILTTYFDIPFAIIEAFLFVRFIMSISRLIVAKDQDEKFTKPTILFIAFFALSTTVYTVYYTFPREKFDRDFKFGVILMISSFLITILSPHGFISDSMLVMMSIAVSLGHSENHSTFLYLFRFLISLISIISALFKFLKKEDEQNLFVFSLYNRKKRIIFFLIIISYFALSPSSVARKGNMTSTVQIYTRPLLYISFFVNEYFFLRENPYHYYCL